VAGAIFIADLEAIGDRDRDAIDFWENVSDFATEFFWGMGELILKF